MTWKKQLQKLERSRAWSEAIEFMKKVIDEYPEDMDAYLFMNYLLANLISEEHDWDLHNEDTFNGVVNLLKKYIDESYEKFSENSEYLFYTAIICGYVDWYFGNDNKDHIAMFKNAIALEPDNLFYKQIYLRHVFGSDPMKEPRDIAFAKKVLAEDPSIKKIFDEKGALGESIWWSLIYNSREVLGLPRYSDEERAGWNQHDESR